MAKQQGSGAHAVSRRTWGGRLLWLWLLLAMVSLALLAWAISGALNDDDEAPGGLPAGAGVAQEAFLVGLRGGQTAPVRRTGYAGEQAPESSVTVEEGEALTFTGVLQADGALPSELELSMAAERLETGGVYFEVAETAGLEASDGVG